MIQRRLAQLKDESGFALVSVLILMMVGTLFALAAWSSSKADIAPTVKDRASKQAYAAAEAGINYYMFRLGQNNAYWTDCDQVAAPNSTEANPVNLEGASTLRWRNVPTTTNQYAIELIAQNGVNPTGNWCTPGAGAAASLLDSSSGTMQIRSTGKVGTVRRSVVATLRRSGFLDYLYFTDFETQDPLVTNSNQLCNVYRRAGRSSSCSTIVFASDDAVNGPFHTNDDIVVCGTPDFGRTKADQIEVQAPDNGWASGCGGGAAPNFKGTYAEDAKHLDMPASNTALKDVALPAYLFTGTTQITLNSSGTMDVKNPNLNGGASTNLAWPANGVVYAQNGANCTASYSAPQIYNESNTCGNIYVKGSYSKSLTIGAQRDILITDSITRSGNFLLGLVANTFIRIYHPVNPANGCSNASSGPFGAAPGNITIDAAILSVGHSFIVDNFDCGAPLGTLTVNGAIAQTYRGPVGQGGSSIAHGYVKNYNYDDRFKVANPPYFLDPVQSSWRTVRYSEQFPARQGG
jgi:Tfp pilus assembly protein PilX